MKRFLHDAVFSLALSGIAGIFPSFSAPMLANSAPILLSQNVNFKHPDFGAPDNRKKGTPAGVICPRDLSIIALIPPSNRGLTVAESPILFAYISQASTRLEFILQTQDTNQTLIYETTFTVEKAGIVGVSIPATRDKKKSIEVGKEYQWVFSVVCDPEDRSTDYYVHGLVQRIEPVPSLTSELANPDPMARAIAYAKNEIWYDTVATLADMRRKAPDDAMLTAEWRHLLQSQKLDSIANQPLVQFF
ncbi:DUF928 domain-containing protein [Microcoleus sp. B7-D4]|uniref:DUF928 domain-containing protein n=1 Tax=Microcoleus sp. B7-D4 TaxID=2818696 RepID=UPI002FD20F68